MRKNYSEKPKIQIRMLFKTDQLFPVPIKG